MVRSLVLLFGAAVAQDPRPWAGIGARLGLPGGVSIPKSLDDAINAVRELGKKATTDETPASPAVGGAKDENGCVMGGGYRWCEDKKKCLREWEEPCKEGPVPVCATGEVVCTELLQRQGMNCVVGACVKAPASSMSAMRSRPGSKRDANGCILGAGYKWCEAKSKCLRPWEEKCEAPSTVVCPAGQFECIAAWQKQGMNCVLGSCVTPPVGSPPVMGGERDANGCVKGGGYTWCEGKKKCLRQWEEACEEVAAPPAMGSGRDAGGCVTGGGYTWCEGKKKCLRQWEEACEDSTAPAVGGTKDEHGCAKGGGYTWCEGKNKCLRQWEEACEESVTAPVGNTQDDHGCAMGGGYRWCENKNKCLREWEEPCDAKTDSPVSRIREMMNKHARPDLRKYMAEWKDREAQYQIVMRQKFEEIKNTDIMGTKFGVMRDRVQSWANAKRAGEQPKIGAHEDNRVSEKNAPVAEGVI